MSSPKQSPNGKQTADVYNLWLQLASMIMTKKAIVRKTWKSAQVQVQEWNLLLVNYNNSPMVKYNVVTKAVIKWQAECRCIPDVRSERLQSLNIVDMITLCV